MISKKERKLKLKICKGRRLYCRNCDSYIRLDSDGIVMNTCQAITSVVCEFYHHEC